MRTLIFVVVMIFMSACAPNVSENIGEPTMPETAKTDTIKINYIELPVTDMAATKVFYTKAFGWSYVDYGPTYAAFQGAGIDGGLDAASDRKPSKNGALIVLHTKDLEGALASVEAAKGVITVPIFEFPGGSRFHFTDPNGNELAVWTTVTE